MILHLFSLKLIIFYMYLASSAYVHWRGKVRFKWWRHLTDHATLLAPINAVLYLFSRVPATPYLDVADFPELKPLRDHWKVIRDEAQVLFQAGHIKTSTQYDDIGFNSFLRKGWRRFYIKWYDEFHPSATALCPKTIELLKQVPTLNAAMFAMLPKGSRLVRHRDPYAGSLRYHLGLITPNSEACRIYVDGQMYYWEDGKDVIFDETFIHYAENETDQDRVILFCDIERPLTFKLAVWYNRFFKRILMRASATKNMPGDRVGAINKAFKYLYAVRRLGKKIKSWNKPIYYLIKYTIMLGLLYLIFFRTV